MNDNLIVTHRKDAKLDFEGGADVGLTIDRIVDETMSEFMTSGYFRMAGETVEMTMPNEEVLVCLEGELRMVIDGNTHNLTVGDSIRLPKGIHVTTTAEDAVAFWAAALPK